MTDPPLSVPARDAILEGPFWRGPVQVLFAELQGKKVRIQAIRLNDRVFEDRTLTLEQFQAEVRERSGGLFRFDAEPRLFRLAVEALRTQLAYAFDPQFAVSVSQVDPLPHQLDAVYRHMLPLPRIRFLLADDPGAGKTIMAGLLLRELMQRQDVRRVLVLCPKALTDQWRREMLERFRERFTLLTGDLIAGSFGQNAWLEHDRVVASVDLAVQEHITPGLDQAPWDLIIFDEAHKLSAYRYGPTGKIDKTKRYQLAERLAKRTRHLLLMTATPHRGDDENFRLLLSLLDDRVFATRAGMEAALGDREHSPYFLRRMKESMRSFEGRPLFLPRHVQTLDYDLEAHEQALYDAVTEYVGGELRKAEASSRRRNVSLALTVLQRRLASSLYAITRSLERRKERLEAQLRATRAEWLPAGDAVAFDPDEDDLDELTDEQETELSASTTAQTTAELRAEIAVLDGLLGRAATAQSYGSEKKLREFRQLIDSAEIREHGEKLLIFTEHRDTLFYLEQKLREWGHSVCVIHGLMRLQDRIAAEKAFRGPLQFMVATDAAGEGINLQFCRRMINWDLPWNPNRLEQRMGRIHRYGQQSEVLITNLVAASTREGQVQIRLLEKLERMREQLGHDQVYDVISGVCEGAKLNLTALYTRAIAGTAPLDTLLGQLDFIDSEGARAAAREALAESLATRHIDLAYLGAEERVSKERRLTPEYVERFFVDALRRLDGRISEGRQQDWRVEFVPVMLRQRLRAANAGEAGLDETRVITFMKERSRREPPAEFVAPEHPLFDVVLQATLEDGRPALTQGSCFVDRQASDPYLFWLFETAVVNGLGEIVHRRLLALRQSGERFERIESGAVLDLPPAELAPAVPERLRLLANSGAAIAAASESYGNEYRSEVEAEQRRQAAIVEQALTRTLDHGLRELNERLERQLAEQETGKEMAIAIRTTNHEIDALVAGVRERREELARRCAVVLDTPRVAGIAAVLPAADTAGGSVGGDQRAVEQAAMNVALRYEQAAGRRCEDVSRLGAGHDLKSTAPDGSVRYIEVKGHAARGDTTLYYTEWQTAQRMRGEFYIYEVDFALTAPQLWITRDPVGKGLQPVVKVVEYRIPQAALRAVSEEAELTL